MKSSIIHRLFWGVIIVTVGILFLLNQAGVVPHMDIGDIISVYWPVFMILFGIQGLLMQRSGGFWWNPIVILLGCYFLGRNLGWVDWSFSEVIRLIGPIALILLGVSMIFRGQRPCRKRSRHVNSERWNPITPPIPQEPPGPPPAPSDWDEYDYQNTPKGPNLNKEPFPPKSTNAESEQQQPGWGQFHNWNHRHEHKDWWKAQEWHNPNRENHSRFIGDVHLGNEYWELRPLNISHFIGDTTLDLTKAQIPIGETRIYVSSFIGDVKVFVPNDFSVGIQVVSSCLIGDVKVLDQKRGGLFNQMSVETPRYADTDKRIVLVVSSFIGDVRVTKVG